MKILIDNNSDLSNEIVGKIIDDIMKNGMNSTQYYGKWTGYTVNIEHNNKSYHIETLTMKRYFKVFIEEREK